jgi:glycosyltransferase involved in cell wall biosynthesis
MLTDANQETHLNPVQQEWAIVVVGQSPELASGQAKMIGYLLGHHYEHIRLIHVPMSFSNGMDDMGKPSVRKVLHLIGIILVLWQTAIGLRLRGIRPVLYFPPAGPHLVPVLRDIVLLGLSRRLFVRTIFHFHAAGLGMFRANLPRPLRPLFDWAYGSPYLTVATAGSGLTDGQSQHGKTNLVVHNGVPELPAGIVRTRMVPPPIVRLLFVGLLIEDKGIFVLLEALALLKARGTEFEARLIGSFNDSFVEQRARAIVRRTDLDHDIQFEGELRGNTLLQAYADADIFCFPSFFAAESFGLVCVEAMRASLPVVATEWRGIPEVVEHGRTGLIVPPRASGPLADALERLINDPDLRAEFGRRGRERFLTHFTVERFCAEMGNVFAHAISSGFTLNNMSSSRGKA